MRLSYRPFCCGFTTNLFKRGLCIDLCVKILLQLDLSSRFLWATFNINLSQTDIHITPFIHKPLSVAFIFGPYSSGVEINPFQSDLYLKLLDKTASVKPSVNVFILQALLLSVYDKHIQEGPM